MKKYLFQCFLLLSLGSNLIAQQPADYKVVFDLTSRDTLDQRNVIRWLNEISRSNPAAKLEVVMYGKGLELVVKDKSYVPEEVSKLETNKNVSFKVCAIAMKNNNVTQDQLIAGVEIVPDGIFEIVTRQKEGWGYIKAAR